MREEIIIHTPEDFKGLRAAGRLAAETLDYIVAKKLDFFLGQVCKYISRAGKKDPEKEVEDLKKARFYLDRKIELLEKGGAE